jgi:hypothetical protein
MDELSALFVGIGVSKDRLGVPLGPTGQSFCFQRDARDLDDLTVRLRALPAALAVLEATGGFEGAVAATRAGSATSPEPWAALPGPTPSTPRG